MSYIPTKTTYLEMFAPPTSDVAVPRADVCVEKVESPSTATGSGVVFGLRRTIWKTLPPKTTPDPFRKTRH
jgi:hypothetical protein